MPTPEEKARDTIDYLLAAAGWQVQNRNRLNVGAAQGVALREFPLSTGFADYLLFVDRQAVGVIEAKAEGMTLAGVAEQSGQYLVGLPANIPHVQLPLPFACESTGIETYFRDERDPEPRSRRVFAFHRPETLAEWAGGVSGDGGVAVDGEGTVDGRGAVTAPLPTLRGRLRQMPALLVGGGGVGKTGRGGAAPGRTAAAGHPQTCLCGQARAPGPGGRTGSRASGTNTGTTKRRPRSK